MKQFLLPITLVVAFLIEITISRTILFFNISPIMTVLVLFLWFLVMPLTSRIWLGIGVGFVLDSISLTPFGVHMISFVIAALLIEFLQNIFLKTNYRMNHAIIVGISVLFFFNLLPFIYTLFNIIRGEPPVLNLVIVDSFIWGGAAFISSYIFYNLCQKT